MDRTSVYEDNLRRIETLRNQEIAARTLVRSYNDYVDVLVQTPTMGAIADHARADLVEYAKSRVDKFAFVADQRRAEADKLQNEGI